MSQETEEIEISRRWKWNHPLLLAFGPWLGSLYVLFFSAFMYWAALETSPTGRVPGEYPFPEIVIGLIAGFAAVKRRKRFLKSYEEKQARKWVFPQPYRDISDNLRQELPQLIHLLAAIGADLLLGWLLARTQDYYQISPISIMIIFASFLLPFIFLYPDWARIYQRAQELATQTRENIEAYQSRTVEKISRTPTVIGILSVIALLVAGAWLQWWVPYAAQAEPQPYMSVAEPGGRATRLTYGADALAPVISPDGKFIAYVCLGIPFNQLEIMRADGSGKQRIGTDKEPGPSPSGFSPMQWSPDGSRLLLTGEQAQPITGISHMPERSYIEDVFMVDISTGKAKQLTKNAHVSSARWVFAGHKILLLKPEVNGIGLWIMDEQGGPPRKIPNLMLASRTEPPYPWRDGKKVIAAGADACPGIWSVEVETEQVTKVSELDAQWAIPFNDEQILVVKTGRARDYKTSIGLLDVKTNQVHWLLQDLQGKYFHPYFQSSSPFLYFTLWSLKNGTKGLYVLPIPGGKLNKITRDGEIQGCSIAPDGKWIAYGSPSGDAKRRSFNILGAAIWRMDLRKN